MSKLYKGVEPKRRTQGPMKTEGASPPASVPADPPGWVPASPPAPVPASPPASASAGSPGWVPASPPASAPAGPPGWVPASPPASAPTDPPGWAPAGPSGWVPAGPSGWVPAGPSGWVPADPPGWLPADPPGWVPAGPPGWMPAGPPGWVLTDPPGWVPAGPPGWVPASPPGSAPADPPATVPVDPPATVPIDPPAAVSADPPGLVPANPPATVRVDPPAAVPAGPPAAVPVGPPGWVPAGPRTEVPDSPPTAVPASPPTAVPTSPSASVLSYQDEQQGQDDPNMVELKKGLRNWFQELNHQKPEKRKPAQEWKNGVLRLLDTETIRLAAPKSSRSISKSHQPTPNRDQTTPEYAILSHRWSDGEVSFKEIQDPTRDVEEKQGYKKVEQFCNKAKENKIRYAWVDTCCIDKDSSAELSQSINSMFEWYKDARECYVYLADVSDQSDSELRKELKELELEKERLEQKKEDELDKEVEDELDEEVEDEWDEEVEEEELDNEREEVNENLEKLGRELENLKTKKEMLKRLLKNRASSRRSGEISPKNYQVDLEKSEWFTRSWTLQELIAPRKITFYDRNWNPIGSKEDHCKLISRITRINPEFLRLNKTPGGEDFERDIRTASISARMSWASGRETTREEDVAYSLLGIFGVSMPALYGEGGHQAFIRLQEEIIKKSDDQTILAWSRDLKEDLSLEFSGALASKPADFAGCGHFIPDELEDGWGPFTMTNQGLQIELPLIPFPGISTNQKVVGAILGCRPRKAKELQNLQGLQVLEKLQWQELEELQQLLVIPLVSEGSPNQYVRLSSFGRPCFVRAHASCLPRQTIYIKQFGPSLPGKAESSGATARCDGFLLRKQDPFVAGYRCKSIPEGSFDDITHAIRRPSTGQPSWEVKLNFKRKSKGLEGLIPNAFDVILGYSEEKGKYCRIGTLLNIPGVFPDSDRTYDSGGGVRVFLIEKPLKLASGDCFTIVDIEMEPGLMRKVTGIFGGIWQNVAEYSKTNQKDKFRRTVERGEEKGGKIMAPDDRNHQKRDKLLRIVSDGTTTVQPSGHSSIALSVHQPHQLHLPELPVRPLGTIHRSASSDHPNHRPELPVRPLGTTHRSASPNYPLHRPAPPVRPLGASGRSASPGYPI